MPVAPVDANGTVLYYEDSGPLEGNYTTFVIVHGTAFHGGEHPISHFLSGILSPSYSTTFKSSI